MNAESLARGITALHGVPAEHVEQHFTTDGETSAQDDLVADEELITYARALAVDDGLTRVHRAYPAGSWRDAELREIVALVLGHDPALPPVRIEPGRGRHRGDRS